MSSRWVQLDLMKLIRVSIDNVIVDWIGHPGHKLTPEVVLKKCNIVGVKARQLKIGTRQVWQNEIENDGYVVDCHDGRGNAVGAYDPSAVHFTLKEYGVKYGNNPDYQNRTGDILVSAFDISKNKRVIVDGIHRGAVMSSKYSNDSDYSQRIVYEWYGDRVGEIFTYDFMPFYRGPYDVTTSPYSSYNYGLI